MRADLVLVDVLRCPRCGKMVFNRDPELFRGSLKCEVKRCGQRWWATALSPGSVRAQLLMDFEDGEVVDALLIEFNLPASLDAPKFWQIPLTGNQSHHYTEHGSRSLLDRLARLLRLAGDQPGHSAQ